MMTLKMNNNITSEILFVLLILLFQDGNGSCTVKLDERGPENDHPMILDIHGKVIYPTDGRKLSFSKPTLITECHINVFLVVKYSGIAIYHIALINIEFRGVRRDHFVLSRRQKSFQIPKDAIHATQM